MARFLGFGFYPRSGFVQIDLGPKRESGERFAPVSLVTAALASIAVAFYARIED